MSSPTPSEDGNYDDDKPKRKSVANRKLIRWNPDKDQLVLLALESVCTRMNISVPWDHIAREIEPYLSGEAIKQHLTKVYHTRVAHKFRVPGRVNKPTRKVKNEGDDDDEPPVQSMPYGKNAGLLHWTPEKTKKCMKKIEDVEPATPTPKKKAAKESSGPTPKVAMELVDATPKPIGASRGARREKARAEEDDDVENNDFTTPSKSTGKRGRPAGSRNVNTKKDDMDDLEAHNGSPAKKRKNVTLPTSGCALGLRSKPKINYNEQPELDDEDLLASQGMGEDEAYNGDLETQTLTNRGSGSTQSSTTYNIHPPPPFNMPKPNTPSFHQSYPPMSEPDYMHSSMDSAYPSANYDGGNIVANGLPSVDSSQSRYVPDASLYFNDLNQADEAVDAQWMGEYTSSPTDMHDDSNGGLALYNQHFNDSSTDIAMSSAPAISDFNSGSFSAPSNNATPFHFANGTHHLGQLDADVYNANTFPNFQPQTSSCSTQGSQDSSYKTLLSSQTDDALDIPLQANGLNYDFNPMVGGDLRQHDPDFYEAEFFSNSNQPMGYDFN